MKKLSAVITVYSTEVGSYSIDPLAQEFVELIGSPGGLATLDVSGMVDKLYRDTLHQAREANEGGGDDIF